MTTQLVSIIAFVTLIAGAVRAQTAEVKAVTPGEIKYSQHPALAKGAMKAVVYGDPTKSGMYVTRLRAPNGLQIMPHTHPEDRIYTVLSGTLYLGVGEKWDESKLVAYPQGSVVFLPAKLSHFQYSKSGEYLIQISADGPTDLTFINPADDLRRH